MGGLERLERISSKVFIVPTGSGLRRARRLASGWVQSRAVKVGGNWDIVDAKTTAEKTSPRPGDRFHPGNRALSETFRAGG